MKNTLAVIGTSAYKHYILPLPNVVKQSIIRAVLSHIVSTTVSLIVIATIRRVRGTEETS